MKRVYFLAVTFLLSVSYLHSQETVNNNAVENHMEDVKLDWVSSFKKAKKKAKKQNKPILIYFTGSDWCGPCIKLDKKLFHTEKFASYAKENMILYMADFPRNKDLVKDKVRKVNKALSQKYSQREFPTLIMVNHKGEELGKKRGMYMIDYYYPFFDEVLKKNY